MQPSKREIRVEVPMQELWVRMRDEPGVEIGHVAVGNVSRRGLFVLSGASVRPGQRLELEVEGQGHSTFSAHGTVRWVRSESGDRPAGFGISVRPNDDRAEMRWDSIYEQYSHLVTLRSVSLPMSSPSPVDPVQFVLDADTLLIDAIDEIAWRGVQSLFIRDGQELRRLDADAVIAIQADLDAASYRRALKAREIEIGSYLHDIRTALTTISAYSALLEEGEISLVDYRGQGGAQAVRDGLTKIEELSSDLLRQFASTAWTSRSAQHLVSAAELIRLVEAMMWPLTKRRQIKLQVNCDSLAPCMIDMAPRDLFRVLLNLVANAIRYSRDGGEVVLEAALQASSLHFSIKDHGVGMSASDVSSLFRPFTTVGEAPPAGDARFGLGLAIVHRLVTAAGGHIDVTSELGVGSEFQVFIPRGQPLA